MNPTALIHTYGYWAIVVGTFFEGEMIMLAAGVLAAAGYLSLPLAMVACMGGIFASDTLCFMLGRFSGARLVRWFPRLHGRLGAVFRLIERHDEKLVIFYQFVPGFCTVTPLAFGMTGIPARRFLLLDLVGNLAWTLVFSIGGYLFGAAFALAVADAHRWMAAAGLILALGVAFWTLWHCRRSLACLVK